MENRGRFWPLQRPSNLLLLFAILAASQFEGQRAAPPQNAVNDCFFVEGKALCGDEGRKARAEHARMVEQLVEQQRERHLKADPDDLPQGDDPRFESRVAFTGRRASGNQKGQQRPQKGQQRPLPTPCPLVRTTTTTTTTTTPPCPLMKTTTPKPLSPCEKHRLQQERMRNNPYVMNDQANFGPQVHTDMMMADSPMPSSNPRGENDELQPRNLEVTTTTETEAVESTTLASHMRSLLPEAVRSSSRSSQQPRLSLYHTFNSNRMISRPSRTSFTGSSVGGGGGHNNNGGYEVTESRPPPASIQDEHVADSAVGSTTDQDYVNDQSYDYYSYYY